MSDKAKRDEWRRILKYAQSRMIGYALHIGKAADNALDADLKWIARELGTIGEKPV